MVRIRLRRVGSKKQPSYRIVVLDGRAPRDGAYIEVIGHYNPRTEPSTDVVKEDRALYWLSVGAQPSDAVTRIFNRTGTTERFKRYRAGEDMEALVAEAEANKSELPNQQTRFPAPGDGQSKQKAREAAKVAADAEAVAVAEAVEAEAVAEPEATEDLDTVEAEAVAVAETAEDTEDVEETTE